MFIWEAAGSTENSAYTLSSNKTDKIKIRNKVTHPGACWLRGVLIPVHSDSNSIMMFSRMHRMSPLVI